MSKIIVCNGKDCPKLNCNNCEEKPHEYQVVRDTIGYSSAMEQLRCNRIVEEELNK